MYLAFGISKNYIRKELEMRDLNGDNRGTINDASITIYVNNNCAKRKNGSQIGKEEISVKQIVVEKTIEAIIGAGGMGIAKLINVLKANESCNSYLKIKFLIILWLIIGTVMLLSSN